MTGIEIEKLTLGKLDEETNDYILCVLSIYKLIENKVITVPEVLGKKDSLTYKLNKNDKRIMALFIGGIISKGIVRNVFYRYEDIRKKDLLNYFGSVEQIASAGIKDIQKVDGINKKTAEKIYNYFNK